MVRSIERGSYGVSAIDVASGKVLWRYKGADKGITNLLVPDRNTIAIADRDDLIFLDASNGKRTARFSHKIERASFGLLNERGDIVIGGQSEIAAFDPSSGRQLWRARHTPPGRGIFRTVAAIAARAASLYFRYGGTGDDGGSRCSDRACRDGFELVGIGGALVVFKPAGTGNGIARNYGTSRFRQFGISSRRSDHTHPTNGVKSGFRSHRSFTPARTSLAFPLASRTTRNTAWAVDVFLHRSQESRWQWTGGSKCQQRSEPNVKCGCQISTNDS